MYDSRIGRWLSIDPKHEFWSPYVGMGNDPVNNTDPDGGCSKCRARQFAAGVDGRVNNLNDGRYSVSWVEDGVANAKIFGQKLSTEVLRRVQMDADFKFIGKIVLPGQLQAEISRIIDFIDRAEAENLQEMLLLSRYQREDITLVGDALRKLQSDPAFLEYEQLIKQQGGSGLSQVTFGGKRGSFRKLGLLVIPIVGLLDKDNIKTIRVASNELTWMVRNCYIQASPAPGGGINYELEDVFNLTPDANRSGGYRAITGVLGTIYHKMGN